MIFSRMTRSTHMFHEFIHDFGCTQVPDGAGQDLSRYCSGRKKSFFTQPAPRGRPSRFSSQKASAFPIPSRATSGIWRHL